MRMPTIRELRERLGWSQRRLARELGVSSQAVLYWESGAKSPTVAHLRALARIFGVSMDDVILGVDHPAAAPPPAPTEGTES